MNATVVPQDVQKLVTMPEECVVEMKVESRHTHNLLVANVGKILNCEDYSTLSHLQRVTACVLRAVKLFKGNPPLSCDNPLMLTPDELTNAERLWIIHAQASLPENKKFCTWRHQFDLFIDDKNLWRCPGRLANADLPYSTKYPVLLPRSHPLTPLIVQDAHDQVGHNGVKETLTEIRRKFWIVKGRSLVRSTIFITVSCAKDLKDFYSVLHHHHHPCQPSESRRSHPFHIQAWTSQALSTSVPFGFSRFDKVWICLFTCLITRAVHLDITTDLSTETFLRYLKRFAARRGLPHKFLSDNGKTFKAAARFMKTVFKDKMVLNHLSDRGVEWLFNIEKAPWWGGAFERLVKSTKRCLRKMVG